MVSLDWTGLGDGSSWGDPDNWCPPIVPDEIGEEASKAVIDGDFTVNLDISPKITLLDVLNGAELQVIAATGSHALTVSGHEDEAVINHGVLRANDGEIFTITTPGIDQDPDGAIEAFNSARVVVVDALVSHGFVQVGGGGLIDLQGTATLDNVGVSDLIVPDTQSISLDGVAINVNNIFVDAQTASTRLNALSELTLRPPPDWVEPSELILGHGTFAFLGDAGQAIINDVGHEILGAGLIQGASLINRELIEAGPTGPGGTVPETLTLQAELTSSEGVLRAVEGFTLEVAGPVEQTDTGLIEAGEQGSVVIDAAVSEPNYLAFRMLVLQDCTVDDVCDRLDMNRNQVYKAKSRVLHRVRRILAELDPDSTDDT